MAPTPGDPERDPVRAMQRAVAPALTIKRREGEKYESKAVPANLATVKMINENDSRWAASALERKRKKGKMEKSQSADSKVLIALLAFFSLVSSHDDPLLPSAF